MIFIKGFDRNNMTEYIHYGHGSEFIPQRFVPIHNTQLPRVKPEHSTGLWASPIDSDNSWKDWCECNDFHVDRLNTYFKFELTEGSKIIFIDSEATLKELYELGYKHPRLNEYKKTICMSFYDLEYYLDFEKLLADGYDAVEVKINADTYFSLYGWDCDSIIILNPDCIVPVE